MNYQQFEDLQEPELPPKTKYDKTYDADLIPPDFELAEIHRQATRVGEEIEQDEENINRCPCCLRVVDRKIIKMNSNVNRLSFLGSGLPLYFNFYKYCVIILVLLFSTSGDYNLITNYAFGTNCSDFEDDQQVTKNDCQADFITLVSLANKRYNYSLMELQQMLNLVSIIIIIGLLQYFRTSQRAIDIECDTDTLSPSDYTIVIKNIPVEFFKSTDDTISIEIELKDYFRRYLEKNVPLDEKVIDYIELRLKKNQNYTIPDRIVDINLCYDLQELQKIQNQKQNHIIKKQELLSKLFQELDPDDPTLQLVNGQYGNEDLNKIQIDINNVSQRLTSFHKSFDETQYQKKYFLGQAFLTFQWASDKDAIVNINSTTSWGRFFGQRSQLDFEGHYLIVDEAPEPQDVNWENLHIKNREKLLRRIAAIFLGSLILYCTSQVIFNVQKIQQAFIQGADVVIKRLASIASILIIMVNYLLAVFIKWVASLEGFSTTTGYHISVGTWSGFAQFINSAIITWLVNTLYIKNYFGEGGLIYNQTYVFISNMIIPAVLSLIDPMYLWKNYKRHKEIQKGKKSTLTQEQLNLLYEDLPESLSDRYASILKTMFLTSFYASIIPVGILLSCISLITIYWTSKHNIISRRVIKNSYSSDLSIEMTENLELILPIYCFSNFWFEYVFTEGAYVSSFAVIGIAIGILNAVLPMQDFNIAIFQIRTAESSIHPFSKVYLKMDNDYARSNPITSWQAKQKLIRQKTLLVAQKMQKKKSVKPESASPFKPPLNQLTEN